MHPGPADLATNCVQYTHCYIGVARATRGDNKADHHSSQLQPRPGQHTINHQPPVLLLGIITHSLVALSCTNTGYGCINPVDNVDMVPQQLPLQSCCFSFLLLGSLHEERPRTLALVVLGSLCRPSVNTSTVASHQQGGELGEGGSMDQAALGAAQ